MANRNQKILKFVGAGVLIYALIVMVSDFLSGVFGYHDLTLINEFLGSTSRFQGLFRVAQGDYSHFEIHFTPTLLLLVPFYWFSDSQALLLVLNALALVIAGFIYLRIATVLSRNASINFWERVWLPLALFLFFTLSRYPKNIVMAASCWFPYLIFSGLAFLNLLRREKLWKAGLCIALALGVRQDAGLFLSSQLLLLAFLPRQFRPDGLRKEAILLSMVSLIYTLLFALWLGPLLGMVSHVNRGWSRYGSSWGEIIQTALTSPGLVFQDLKTSAFLRLNLSVAFLALIHPVLFLFAHGPGILFYLCDDPTKKYLCYYNAGFLLPGVFLAISAGALTLSRFKWADMIFKLVVVLLILTLFDHDMLRMRPIFQFKQTAPIRAAIQKVLRDCPKAKSVSADFRSIVFFPSHQAKFMLDKFDKADLVVFGSDYEVGLPGQKLPPEELRSRIRNSGYVEKPVGEGAWAFVNPTQICQVKSPD